MPGSNISGKKAAIVPQGTDVTDRLVAAGVEVRAEAQQHSAGIASVPAAFVTLRIPLGAKKKKPD